MKGSSWNLKFALTVTTEKQFLGKHRANLETFVIKLETGNPEKEGFGFLNDDVDLGCFPLFPLVGWMNIYLAYPMAVRSVQVPKGKELPVSCCRSYQNIDPVLQVYKIHTLHWSKAGGSQQG